MSHLRTLHEFHERHENAWWIILGTLAAIGLLLAAGTLMGWWL